MAEPRELSPPTETGRSASRDGRSTPTAIDSQLAGNAARKRDRDSQFGPTTPGEYSTFSDLGQSGEVSNTQAGTATVPAAKKNRVVSRDNSFAGSSSTPQDGLRVDTEGANTGLDEDLDVTPPGTPVATGSVAPSPSIPGSALRSRMVSGPETSKVKEMRERVQEMTTDEEAKKEEDAAYNDSLMKPPHPPMPGDEERKRPSESAPNSPPPAVEEEIADMAGSAAEAEREEQHQQQGDAVTIEEPEAELLPPTTSLPPSQPLSSRAVASLGRASSLIPPPSPASSVRAETGSDAGDSDYINSSTSQANLPGRPINSRMSSVSSMRSINYQSNHPNSLLHSSLPRSQSGLDTPVDNTDALSDVSTDVCPPETPRPVQDVETPTTNRIQRASPDTPLVAVAGAVSQEENGTEPPPPTPTPAGVGEPSSSATVPQVTGNSTATPPGGAPVPPAKPFVNPFSSFGGSSSSPFGSSSTASPFGSSSTSNSKSATTSGFGGASTFGSSSTASPFGSTSAASPFASAGAKASSEAEDDQQEKESRYIGDNAVEEQGKIFSSQSEVRTMTGEEEEFPLIVIPRAKLYIMDGGEWKERGVGQIKLNENQSTGTVRLVMRADAVHRLILNIPLFSGMSVTLASDRYVRFSGFEDGKPKHYTIRLANANLGKELHEKIEESLSELARKKEGKGEEAV